MDDNNKSQRPTLITKAALEDATLISIVLLGFSVLGGAFLLMFGDHWFGLSRTLKLVVSTFTGLMGIGLPVFMLIKKTKTTAFREIGSAGAVVFISISFLLYCWTLSYRYEFATFFLLVFSVSVVVSFLFKSGFATAFALLAILLFLITGVGSRWSESLFLTKAVYLLGFGLSMFVLLRQIKVDTPSLKAVLLFWCLAFTLPIGMMALVSHFQLLVMPLVFTVMYLLGKLYLSGVSSIFYKPLQVTAVLMILGYLIVLTTDLGALVGVLSGPVPEIAYSTLLFDDVNIKIFEIACQFEFDEGFSALKEGIPVSNLVLDYVLIVGLAVLNIMLSKTLKSFNISRNWFVANFPLWVIIALIPAALFNAVWSGAYWFGWLILTYYFLFFSMSYLFSGINAEKLGKTIFGVSVLGLFLLFRFADLNFGQVGKGVLFTFIGLFVLFIAYLYKMKISEEEAV